VRSVCVFLGSNHRPQQVQLVGSGGRDRTLRRWNTTRHVNSWRQRHWRDHTQVTDQAGAVYPCVLGSIYVVIQVELVTNSLRPKPTTWVTTHFLDYFNKFTLWRCEWRQCLMLRVMSYSCPNKTYRCLCISVVSAKYSAPSDRHSDAHRCQGSSCAPKILKWLLQLCSDGIQ
jgi:hypothetical protein